MQTASPTRIRPAAATDGEALANIYNYYVANTAVTFEESPVAATDMEERLAEATRGTLPFLVAEAPDRVIGFAYATKWKGRCAYRFSVETTVYVAHGYWRRGVGAALYQQLIVALKDAGFHALIGGIALPNESSVALHEKFGFVPVARFREVGFKFGRWIDVGYWQLLLDSPAMDRVNE
jgi:L-amino acid N-acyltransferase YncA